MAEIVTEIHALLEFRWPERMKMHPLNKYCEFHQDHGHDLEECIMLRIDIEKLIKNGKLARYIIGQ